MNAIGIIAILLAVVAILLVSWGSGGVQMDSPAQLAEPVFHRVYGSLSPMPTLKVSWSYSYPCFDVAFASKAEMERAGAANAEFKRQLNILFSGYGAGERRFDAELAASFTYPGYIDDLVAALRQKREQNQPPQTAPVPSPHV